ncbi:hypothetical protein JOD63_001909 [Microbacterium terrae]|nr:hypothetical protein [Microbacterium terrae]MBP1077941.1 hypothetical protein [Microbacterium terrae]GLK00113.1 hypothetical protein GCM10017594_33100 [Microbacterium terrae]
MTPASAPADRISLHPVTVDPAALALPPTEPIDISELIALEASRTR